MYDLYLTNNTTQKMTEFCLQSDSALIKPSIKFLIGNNRYDVNLIMEHPRVGIIDLMEVILDDSVFSNLTVTELKRCLDKSFKESMKIETIPLDRALPNISLPAFQLMKIIYNELCKAIEMEEDSLVGKVIRLPKQFLFEGQTIGDTVYEWRRNQYGDTSTFCITSFKVDYVMEVTERKERIRLFPEREYEKYIPFRSAYPSKNYVEIPRKEPDWSALKRKYKVEGMENNNNDE